MSDARSDDLREQVRARCIRLLESGDGGDDVIELATELLRAIEEADHLRTRVEEIDELAQQLAAERLQYRELFDAAPDPYVVTDLHGMVRERNDMAATTLDLRPGNALVLLVDDPDRSAFHRFLNRQGETGGRVTLRCQTEGGPRAMDIHCESLGSRRLLWLFRDVTEVEAIRQQLKDIAERDRVLAEQLRQLDATRGAFLLAVAHDLRTPLAAIAGFAGLLADGKGSTEDEQQEIIERISTTSTRLVALLGELLDLERLERLDLVLHRVETDVGALVPEVIERVALGTRDVAMDISVLTADVDRVLFERILENLLRNEAQHTPDGCHLWIRCSREPDGVLLVVEDDGPGVPVDLVPRIFELFERDRSSGGSEGFGVGLTLVRRFAQLHGGYAQVFERQGGGASFHVLLPES